MCFGEDLFCGRCWPVCRCRGPPTGAWFRRSTSATGSAPTPRRPDAPTSAERLFCHVYDRSGRCSDQSCPAGRTRSSPPSNRAGRLGASCWTPSVPGPRTTSPKSRPPNSAVRSRTCSRWVAGTSVTATSSSSSTRAATPRAGPPPRRPPGRGAGTDALRPRHTTAQPSLKEYALSLPPGRATAAKHRSRRALDLADHRHPTHTQIRLLREATADLRRPGEKPAEPGRLTPARVRRGVRNLRPHLHCPARPARRNPQLPDLSPALSPTPCCPQTGQRAASPSGLSPRMVTRRPTRRAV